MSWTYSRKLTIAKTASYLGTTDQSAFPVLVSGTFSYLASANLSTAGNVTTHGVTYPKDIAFYSDAALTTLLPFEIAFYDSSTGKIEAWVQVPTLYGSSGAQDTVFYMAYKNAAQSTDLSNVGGVWDAHFLGVWHFPDGTTLTAKDSTSNANDGTLVNTPTATVGKLNGGAASFASASTQAITAGTAINPAKITLSAWVKPTTFASTYMGILGRDNGTQYAALILGNGGHLATYMVATGAVTLDPGTGTLIADGAHWYYVTAAYDSVNGLKTYLNAVSDGTAAANGALNATAATFRIGSDHFTPRYMNGVIDEARVSDINRLVDWVKAEYGNMGDLFANVSGQTIGLAVAVATGADTAGGTDVPVRSAMHYARTCSDTAGGTDVATGPRRFATDTAGGTDVATQLHSIHCTAADTAGETAVGTAHSNRQIGTGADTAGGTDVATRMFRRTGADTAGISEGSAPTRVRNFGRIALNPSGFFLLMENGDHLLKEDGGKLLLDGGEFNDIAGGSDNATGHITMFVRLATDTAGASDVAVRTNLKTHQPAADTAGATDVTIGQRTIIDSSADTAGGTEAATRTLGIVPRTGADTAGESDSAQRTAPFSRTDSDTAGGSDAATRALEAFVRNTADTAGASDFAAQGVRVRFTTDTAGGTDACTRSASNPRTAADTAAGTDSNSRHLVLLHSSADTAGASDNATSGIKTAFTSDTAGATDACVLGGSARPRLTVDVAGGSIGALRSFVRLRSCTDIAGPSDSSAATANHKFSTDVVGGSESTSRVVTVLYHGEWTLDGPVPMWVTTGPTLAWQTA